MYNKLFLKKNELKTIIFGIILMIFAGLCVVFLSYYTDYKYSKKDENQVSKDKQKYINLWYFDNSFETYVNLISKMYEEDTGVKVNARYISDLDYFKAINNANNSSYNISKISKNVGEEYKKPDVYILPCEKLESAYGYGLAQINSSHLYSEKNFLGKSINDVTYKGKKIAYPLAYDVGFMAYNTEYVNNTVDSIEDIIKFSDEFDGSSKNITSVFSWDINSLVKNYCFLGNGLEFGGKAGDNENDFSIDIENTIKNLKSYKDLIERFGITGMSEKLDIVEQFLKNKIVFTILNSGDFYRLFSNQQYNENKIRVCSFPKVASGENPRGLSKTTSFVINYFSDNKEISEDFIKYASYDKSDLIYEYLHLLPARKTEYLDTNLKKIQQVYENSNSLPKLIISNDYFIRLQILFDEVIKGKDSNELLKDIISTYKNRQN